MSMVETARRARRSRPTNIKAKCGRSKIARRFCLSFSRGCDHLPYATMFATRGEHFQALFFRTPLQDVDVYMSDAPLLHLELAWLVQINGVGADQRIPIVVDNIFFVRLGDSKPCSERIS